MARTKKKKTAKKTLKKSTRKTVAARRRVIKKATARKTVKKRRAVSPKVKKRRTVPKKTIKRKAASKKKKAATGKKTAPKRRKTVTKKKIARKKTIRRKAASGKTVKRKAAPVKKAVARTRAGKRAVTKTTEKNQARIIKPQESADALKRGKTYQLQKGEDYMSTQQLEHFNMLLLNWKKELMKEVDRTVSHMQTDVTNFADPADRATQEEEFGLELRARDRERKLIRKIDEALGMIGTEEYGYCNLCGAEIGIRRLEARPTATLCIDCKTLQEVRERQVAD